MGLVVGDDDRPRSLWRCCPREVARHERDRVDAPPAGVGPQVVARAAAQATTPLISSAQVRAELLHRP